LYFKETIMRRAGWLLLAVATLAFAQMPLAQTPPVPATPAGTPPSAPLSQTPDAQAAPAARPAPVGTMSELMLKVIYPYSDAMFYIQRAVPKNDVEWNELQGKALALAEFGNLMMMPGRARDQDQWLRDAKLLADAGRAAFTATKAKDVDAVVALNDQLVTSCTSCHMHYRPNYGRRRGAPPPVATPK
jgi:mono/diheme cytochrome c family protein